jgi:zinc transport system substrate-binding protein
MRHCCARKYLFVFLAAVIFFAGAGSGQALAAGMDIFVSIPPQAFLVRKIGGEHVTIHTLLDKGQNPHTFEPSPRQLLRLSNSKILFTIGLPFEKRLLSMIGRSYRNLDIIATDQHIRKRRMEDDHSDTHHEDTEDPHIWLSPLLLKTQADTICRALIDADPANRTVYQRNRASLLKRLDTLHLRLKKILSPYLGRTFYVFHPAFGYFADTYGIIQKPVEFEGKKPSPKQLAEFIKEARADGIKTIFVQPQFDSKSAMAVARSINGELVELDSMAENIFQNLLNTAGKIARSFSHSSQRVK